MVTVISGSCHLGHGEKFDENTGQTMGAGGFVAIPAGAKHFAWATEESVQIHGEGPFGIKHVDPADDPREEIDSRCKRGLARERVSAGIA